MKNCWYSGLPPDRVSVSERMGIDLYRRGNPYQRDDPPMQYNRSLRLGVAPAA